MRQFTNTEVMHKHNDIPYLIGCGILRKEINRLIIENNWQLHTTFLDSSLHFDFDKLHKNLTSALNKHSNQNCTVFYGTCHPLMENILYDTKTTRTKGQNCVEILLGSGLFTKELSNGAYFLLEDWALRWDYIIPKTFGTDMEVTRQIFQEDRKYLLGIRTPCSGDFTKEAEHAAQSVGLPLHWMNVDMDHLKSVLISALNLNNRQYNGR